LFVERLDCKTSAFPSLSFDEWEGLSMPSTDVSSKTPRFQSEKSQRSARKLKVVVPEDASLVADAIDALADVLIDMAVAAGKVPAART
jgi:hypothetical protein